MIKNVLSYEVDASTGRAVRGKYDGEKLILEEVHRFENIPITIDNKICWDIDFLFNEIKNILQKISKDTEISSIAIDTWGVDFGLLDENGEFMGNLVKYSDDSSIK